MASETEQLAGGYWANVTGNFIRAQLIKPFLGRPYLKLGQCFGLWASLVDLGGLLGSKHRAKLDAFVPAFIGMSGEAGAAERFFVAVAKERLDKYPLNSMQSWDFVAAELGGRVPAYKADDWTNLIMQRGADKMPRDVAAKNAWFYARYGAVLGAMAPAVARGMWERTHEPHSKEDWQQAYAAGLDIGPEPPAERSYEEATEEENKFFMEFCREFYPEEYSVLR